MMPMSTLGSLGDKTFVENGEGLLWKPATPHLLLILYYEKLLCVWEIWGSDLMLSP